MSWVPFTTVNLMTKYPNICFFSKLLNKNHQNLINPWYFETFPQPSLVPIQLSLLGMTIIEPPKLMSWWNLVGFVIGSLKMSQIIHMYTIN